jgi:hypothetical protein
MVIARCAVASAEAVVQVATTEFSQATRTELTFPDQLHGNVTVRPDFGCSKFG